MLNEQLLAYVRENTRAGFSRSEIEQALKNAGWDPADIAAAFSVQQPTTPTTPATPSPVPPLSHPTPRSLYRPATSAGGQSGIVGWMIKKRLVQGETQANMVLILLTVMCLGLAVWIAL